MPAPSAGAPSRRATPADRSAGARVRGTAPSAGPIASLPPGATARDDAGAVTAVMPISPATHDRDDALPVDAFLYELETAADGPRTAELAAYDALTPAVRGISVSLSVR